MPTKDKDEKSEKDLTNATKKKDETERRLKLLSGKRDGEHDIGREYGCQTDIDMEQMDMMTTLMEEKHTTSLDKDTQYYKLCCILMKSCAKTIRKLINHCLPHIKFSLSKLLKIYQPKIAYKPLDDLDLTQLCRLFSDVQRAAIQHHVTDISTDLHTFLDAKKADILRTINDKKAENSLFPTRGRTDIKRWTPSQLIFVFRFVLQEVFCDQIYENGHPNLRNFLLTKKDKIISVEKCKSSESVLYPELKDTDLNTWSSHLIYCMLTEVLEVDVVLHPVLYENIVELCHLRNTIFHSTDINVVAAKYGEYMQTINTHNRVALAYIHDDSFEKEITDEIAKVDKGHILPLDWVFGLIRRLEQTESIGITLKEQGESHEKTHKYLSDTKRIQHTHTDKLTEALQLLRCLANQGKDSQQEVTLTLQQENISSRQEEEASAIVVESFNKTGLLSEASSCEIDKIVSGVKERFEEDDLRIVKADPGCIRLNVQCKDLSSLITLLEKLRDGRLTAIFKPIEEQIKRMKGFEQYRHEVVIDAKDLTTTLSCVAKDITSKEENDLLLRQEKDSHELPCTKGSVVQLNPGTKLKGIAIKEGSSLQLSPGNEAIQHLKESCMEESGLKVKLGDSVHETSATDSSHQNLKQVTGARGVGKVSKFLDAKSADAGPKNGLKRKLQEMNAPKEHVDKMKMRKTLKHKEPKTKGQREGYLFNPMTKQVEAIPFKHNRLKRNNHQKSPYRNLHENIQRQRKNIEKLTDTVEVLITKVGEQTSTLRSINEEMENKNGMDETASYCSIETEDLKQSMRELKQKLVNVCEASSTTSDILQKAVVVKSPISGGKLIKRIQTCSPYEKRFKDTFNQSMEKHLPDNYVPPAHVNNIVDNLKERRFAIVVGLNTTSYLQSALFAIRKVGFDRSMCVQINDANDWIHIDPTETQLVLISDPFGDTCYDEKKTEHLMDNFDDILETTKTETRFAVIFVSKMEVMSEAFRDCKAIRSLSENFMSEMISINDDGNSESSPYGLEEGYRVARMRTQKSIEYDNIVRFSDELKQTAMFGAFNIEDVHNARRMMQYQKHVLIKGKAAIATAVRVAFDYESDQTILLTNPDDIVHVPLGDVSLLVVLDFAGKYRYNEQKAQKWYERFDLIHAMVKRGRINVVLVSDQDKLETCITALGQHPILQHEVDTTSTDFIKIKKEPPELTDYPGAFMPYERRTTNRHMSRMAVYSSLLQY